MLTYRQWQAEIIAASVQTHADQPFFQILFATFFNCEPVAAGALHKILYERVSSRLAAEIIQNNFPGDLHHLGFDIHRREFLHYTLVLLQRINLVSDEEDMQYGLRKGQWTTLIGKVRKGLTLWVKDWLYTQNIFQQQHLFEEENLDPKVVFAPEKWAKYYEYIACEVLLLLVRHLSPEGGYPYAFYYESLLDYLRYRNAVAINKADRLESLLEPRLLLAQTSHLSISDAKQLTALLASLAQRPPLLAYTELAGFSKAVHLVRGQKEDVVSAQPHSRNAFLKTLAQAIQQLQASVAANKPRDKAANKTLANNLSDSLSAFKKAANDPAQVGSLGCSTQGAPPKQGRSGCRSYMWGKKTFLEPVEALLRENNSSENFYAIVRGVLLDPLSPRETNAGRRVTYGLGQQQVQQIYALMKVEPRRYPILGPIAAQVDSPVFRPLTKLVSLLLSTLGDALPLRINM
ncbi:MAG: hypothetical protein KTR20_14255 [Cellvibrionaceae bacterium]|nr:hypothetical protein [Cellvibrionaceae bacterium]